MYESSPGAREAGVTLIDVVCIFAVISVIGWQLVPYLFAIGVALAILIGCIAVVMGLIRLVPFLFRNRQ